MLYYQLTITAKADVADSILAAHSKNCKDKSDKLEHAIKCLNNSIDIEKNLNNKSYFRFTELDDNKVNAVAVIPAGHESYAILLKIIEQTLDKCGLSDSKIEISEIVLAELVRALDCNNDPRMHSTRRIMSTLKLNYSSSWNFELEQNLIEDEKLSHEDAIKQARTLMGSNALLEEVDRIYSAEHPKVFLGHPVHYKIQAADSGAAYATAKLLIRSLYSNGRLEGRRIEKISGITEQCYDEDDMRNLFYQAQGGTIIIELFGNNDERSNYASGYEQVALFFDKLIQKYNQNVLLIFIEPLPRSEFAKSWINKFAENIDIINIDEGRVERNTAVKYLEQLIEESELAEYKDVNSEELQLDKKSYTASEVHNIFNKWSKESLKRRVYTAYSKCNIIKAETISKGTAYEQLQKMVGLSNVKELVDQIIATYRIQKVKGGHATETQYAKHMLFTGNPGSAKTTVARLLAEILKENDVLETGEFVECGRADLVGRYVGWTARGVRELFRRAQGGVLFIDEAYSLVDDSGSFGDEAINTIVQEMENHRDDVIVIFAGYPDKMKLFLNKNEGLRSRIAFHVDFPDYTGNELMEIMNYMLQEKGYSISAAAEEKIGEIFQEAISIPEFGNGRLVRNMLEQAIMKQSARLFREGDINNEDKQRLFYLTENDFELQNLIPCRDKRCSIGFGA